MAELLAPAWEACADLKSVKSLIDCASWPELPYIGRAMNLIKADAAQWNVADTVLWLRFLSFKQVYSPDTFSQSLILEGKPVFERNEDSLILIILLFFLLKTNQVSIRDENKIKGWVIQFNKALTKLSY